MATEIDIKTKAIEGVADKQIMIFEGSLDATNIESVAQKVDDVLSSGINNIIADFNKLRYLNSTALGHIINFNKKAKNLGGSFVLVNVNENVYEIFDIVGATSILSFFDSADEAISATPS